MPFILPCFFSIDETYRAKLKRHSNLENDHKRRDRLYIIAEKGPIQSAVSIHVRFIYDETVFRFVYRCAGQPEYSTAITPFKGSDTESPFITLAAR